jgi:hypothetical protein
MVGLPTKATENSHIQETQNDPVPDHLPDLDNIRIPFTFAIFPRIVVPFNILTQNMVMAQVDPIKAELKKYITLLPHGAGKQYYDHNPHANKMAQEFIESLEMPTISVENIDVALPIVHHKPKCEFDGPWPMILTGASPELAAFLLWHQTFSVNRRLTFHTIPFDQSLNPGLS